MKQDLRVEYENWEDWEKVINAKVTACQSSMSRHPFKAFGANPSARRKV